ncbi:MAG TPA: putative maltokinase, partial [Chthoniobacteraceae bacterium]|nr:putative maltokinase [Chthoniobacteraceae bacterium]
PLSAAERDAGRLAFLQVQYVDIAPEVYLLPLQIAPAEEAKRMLSDSGHPPVARLLQPDGEYLLFDALYDPAFREALLEIISEKQRLNVGSGRVTGIASEALVEDIGGGKIALISRALKAEQSNSSIIYGDKYFLKLYRKLEEGENPDEEMIRHLSEKQKFANVPAFRGAIEAGRIGSPPRVVALLVDLVPNVGDAWSYTLDSLGRYFERVLAQKPAASVENDPAALDELIGGVYPERVRLLAQRTAEMHLALAADTRDADFAPEPYTGFSQRSLYQSMRSNTKRMTQLLRRKLDAIPEKYRQEAAEMIKLEGEILRRQARVIQGRTRATKTRVHGDYHLGQVLNTGKDFVITDFEGEPARALSERKMKRSPLRDVAGMLRSFHYAIHSALSQQKALSEQDMEFLKPWGEVWAHWVNQVFLGTYLETTKGASFIPESPEMLAAMLDALLLEKATYEVAYELNNRPDWVFIPLRGIRRILEK